MDLDDAKIKKIIDSKIIGLRYLWTLKKGISMGLNWFMEIGSCLNFLEY